MWSSILARKGQIVELRAGVESGWGYLAVSGGIQVAEILGSRSTYLPGKWGVFSGRILVENDELPLADQSEIADLGHLTNRSLPMELIPEYSNSLSVRFIPMDTDGKRGNEILEKFQSQSYCIENTNRMAYRLTGNPLPLSETTDILSEGVGAGVIQLLGSGLPLVLMRDAQTTGGYRKLGAVIMADLDTLAQCTSEQAKIRFCEITVGKAQSLWRDKIKALLSVNWGES